jgi:hypothetical protein
MQNKGCTPAGALCDDDDVANGNVKPGTKQMDMGNRTVPLGRNAKYGTMEVDTSKFADHVHDHVYDYGLRQILNDAIADKTDDHGAPLSDGDLYAKAQKRLDTLYSGELRVRRESAEPIDPVDAEVWRMAKKAITTAMKGAPEYAKTKGEKDRVLATIVARGRAATWEEAIAIHEAANPKLRPAATRIVKERAATGVVDVDL